MLIFIYGMWCYIPIVTLFLHPLLSILILHGLLNLLLLRLCFILLPTTSSECPYFMQYLYKVAFHSLLNFCSTSCPFSFLNIMCLEGVKPYLHLHQSRKDQSNFPFNIFVHNKMLPDDATQFLNPLGLNYLKCSLGNFIQAGTVCNCSLEKSISNPKH